MRARGHEVAGRFLPHDPGASASSMLFILLGTGHAIRRVLSYPRWEGFLSVREWGAVVRRARWFGLLARR